MFKKYLYKYEVAEMLGISQNTLRHYLNVLYYKELKEIGYTRRQKYLNPKQLNYLQKKIDLQPD